MQKRNAKFVVPVALVSVVVLAVGTGFSSASGTPTGGAIHIYEADTNYAGSLGTVVITGAITDHGTDHQGAGPGGTNLLVLSKGTFAVDLGDLGSQLSGLRFDKATCSSDATVNGSVGIVPGSGTGAYAGIQPGTMSLGAIASAAFILPRLANGKCDTKATHYPGVLIANASGNVSYAPSSG